ncbi:MAG: hypothetical protein OFPII_36540 [Osedax symbiont Rs1]|nr:MAG: hypothetical protein OFPII_36540 [Osedax symbiont Rs1]
MLTHQKIAHNNIEIDVFNAIIGFQDQLKISDQKKRCQRVSAARRGIEKHHESQLLNKNLAEIWH